MQQTPKLIAIGVFATLLSACGSSDNDNSTPTSSSSPISSSSASSSTPALGGYEASLSDFVGYMDWAVSDYATGATNNKLGEAHANADDAFTRKTFMNAKAAANTGGDFEEGSIIIKETFTYTMGDDGWQKTYAPGSGLLAMVKRGGDFNPDHNGWEWFMLESDLSSVIAQGAEPNGNAGCNACHSNASNDYSFEQPTEFIAEPSLFADYTSWDLIELDTAPNNLSAGAHVDDASERRIYQKQVLANPTEAGDMGYPIGTTLVKSISKDGEIKELVAMVKRGGSFDADNGNWEYFMLDPTDPTTIAKMEGNEVRGAVAMCIGCHTKAKDDAGIDFVFKHSNAPFNTDTTGEYVAHKADFANYTQWALTDYALGVSNPLIGMAHSSSNEEFARAVYLNAKAQTLDGEYPQGSILIKETFTTKEGEKVFAEMGGLLAMVKRGGTYNPDNNGWEWVMLSSGGDILARAPDLMNDTTQGQPAEGACNQCHALGSGDNGIDYTFNTPSTFAVTEDSIKAALANYKTWTLIDEATGAPAANVGGHPTGDKIVRKTYKKQASASPYLEAGVYPVGTIIVKEIVDDGVVGTVYGMIKSGSDWTWLTTNEALSSVNINPSPGCKGCHSKAGDESESDASYLGVDYVFYKSQDPVPCQSALL